MRALLDSSILVATLVPKESDHAACVDALHRGGAVIHVHALNETFANLTGGALGFRIEAEETARLIREKIVACVDVIVLNPEETLFAHRQARARGVRGGAVYDFMHLVAARKANAEVLYTLDIGNFVAFHREGDPEIRRP